MVGVLISELPAMVLVEQQFPRETIPDIEGEVASELARISAKDRISPGERVAITVGSRGIANIARIVKAVVSYLKDLGASPFIIPSMGSHGGSTPEGQLEVLAGYGITSESMGVPIIPGTDVVQIGVRAGNKPVYVDKVAASADKIVVVNRIKAHTDFHGRIESGIIKMLVIGLGNEKGASMIHSEGIAGLRDGIPQAARVILDKLPVAFGIGIIENAYDETSLIRAIPSDQLFVVEPDLLIEAKRRMARLPVEKADLLIVQEMGKDISGSGMDTNIIGRVKIAGEPDLERPVFQMIVVLDLTPGAHGNAIGIGLADFCTKRLADQIDWEAMYVNVITSTFVERGKLPIVCANDRDAIISALSVCWDMDPSRARIVYIKNTLKISRIWVSEPLMEELSADYPIEILDSHVRFEFDHQGRLSSPSWKGVLE